MGEPKSHRPVLRVLVAFSRHQSALDWAWRTAESNWGPIAERSELFGFDDTPYYEASMGTGLKKQLVAFAEPIDPMELVADKRLTNQWEVEYAAAHGHSEQRPLNLDPGYLSEAKFVLATTKDRDHRLYLGQGIFAEVTLHFHRGDWVHRPWTYPDYSSGRYFPFLTASRTYLRTNARRG